MVELESPVQKKAREDYEAMGGVWAGEAPSVKNHRQYEDLICVQSKVRS